MGKTIRIILFCGLLLCPMARAATSTAKPSPQSTPPDLPYDEHRKYINQERLDTDTIDLDGLLAVIFEPNSTLTSVEAVIQWLAKHHPSYLRRFTWMRHSESDQAATPMLPRTIVYGESGRFILTFTDQSLRGGQTLEMMQIREKANGPDYEFRELAFHHGKAHLSEANPARCRRCHYSPMRPLWEEYERWDHAYGSQDDRIARMEIRPGAAYIPASYIQANLEYAQFMAFRPTVSIHPRYQWLPIGWGSPVAPFAPRQKYFDYDYRPNDGLLNAIRRHFGRHVAGRIVRHPNFNELGPLLLANYAGCDHSQNPAHRQLTQALNTNLVRWFEKDQPDAPNGISYYGYERLVNKHSQKPELYLLQSLGVDRETYHPGVHPKDWSYHDGSGDIRRRHVKALWETPYMKEVRRVADAQAQKSWHYDPSPFICDQLLESYEPETDFEHVQRKPPALLSRQVVSMCVDCHREKVPGKLRWDYEMVSPHEKQQIQRALNHQTMPPTRRLSQTEKQALELWLEDF